MDKCRECGKIDPNPYYVPIYGVCFECLGFDGKERKPIEEKKPVYAKPLREVNESFYDWLKSLFK